MKRARIPTVTDSRSTGVTGRYYSLLTSLEISAVAAAQAHLHNPPILVFNTYSIWLGKPLSQARTFNPNQDMFLCEGRQK